MESVESLKIPRCLKYIYHVANLFMNENGKNIFLSLINGARTYDTK